MTNGFEPKHAAALLRSTIAILAAEVGALPREVLTWHPAPGEWCVNEVLGHLIEADRRGFSGRISGMLNVPDVPLVGWDQDEVARARRRSALAPARGARAAPRSDRRLRACRPCR